MYVYVGVCTYVCLRVCVRVRVRVCVHRTAFSTVSFEAPQTCSHSSTAESVCARVCVRAHVCMCALPPIITGEVGRESHDANLPGLRVTDRHRAYSTGPRPFGTRVKSASKAPD